MTSLVYSIRPCFSRSHATGILSILRRNISGDARSPDPISPRAAGIGHTIEDEYAAIRENYGSLLLVVLLCTRSKSVATPKNPIVLAHGLLGFDELRLAGSYLPGIR